MLPLAAVFIGCAILLGSLPLFGAKIVSARGIFLAYVLAGALVPAIAFLINGESLPSFVSYFENRTIVMSIVLVDAFTFIVSYISNLIERKNFNGKKIVIYRQDDDIAYIFAFISILIFSIYIIAMSYLHGGFFAFVDRSYMRISFESSISNFFGLLIFIGFVSSIFCFNFYRGTKRLSVKLVCLAAIALGLILSLASGGRSLAVLYIFALAYPYLVRLKTGRLIITSAVMLILFGIISFYMVTYRYEMQNAIILQEGGGDDYLALASTGIMFLDSIAAAIEYTQHHGVNYGELYLNVLGQPIPRDLWLGKPLQISVLLREYFFGDTSGGVPPGLIGESFIAFGIFGPLLIAPIYAWLLTRINMVSTIAEATDCRVRSTIAGVLIPLIGYALVRGGFDIALVRVGLPALACFGGYWFARSARLAITLPLSSPRIANEMHRHALRGRRA